MSIIGIDLGTSHSSLAFTKGEGIELLPIPQYESAKTLTESLLLPSVYSHGKECAFPLPWTPNAPVLVLYARDEASLNPELTISSSKSWLCYKSESKLPQGAAWGGLSAQAVASALLTHFRLAYESKEGKAPEHYAITVPASFDPLARQLTEDAAKAAGISSFELIEEPLAAFYAWLHSNTQWNKILKPGDSILVCDVGGGTSDFSLIAVREELGELRLDRIAVGRHLLLGGDNMDLALAHYLAHKAGGLDNWQFQSLQQEVRKAKEELLSGSSESYAISVASRGSSLFASTKRIDLTKAELGEFLIEGFFPITSADAEVKRGSGLRTAGLPYETDPAITRHLSAFLKAAKRNLSRDEAEELRQKDEDLLFIPSHILFNGGVFKAKVLEERMLKSLEGWGAKALVKLENPNLDHAVTIGAAVYAKWKRDGSKLRVKTSASRSYYLGIESNAMAVPGLKIPLNGLCVLPLGTEENTRLVLNDQEFSLWAGDEVRFQLFSDEAKDALGDLRPKAEELLTPVAELVSRIDDDGQEPIPVRIEAHLDASGKLELALKEIGGERSFGLHFDIRQS